MAVIIVVGVQWGDEGKGKVVDYLTEKADLVVRFQGGNNAGHTLVIEGKRTALQLIPSGIMRSGTRSLLASGVVLDPFALFEEISRLECAGVDVSPRRLGIAGGVQLILPYHKILDRVREVALADSKIGTTGKGIGPAYEDAVSRQGIRAWDLFDVKKLEGLVERCVATKNRVLSGVYGSSEQLSAAAVLAELVAVAERLKPYIVDVSDEVDRAIKEDKILVFEGAQGSLLDISHGTYPFVTSSSTVAGYACVSAGFSPRYVDHIVGICKAYCTRVGSGPFPTEDFTDVGEMMRRVGKEFGTVTGRPRRCGWFDLVAARQAIRLNGITHLFITKLDVLSGLDKVKIGSGYTVAGREEPNFVVARRELEDAVVSYEELDGWQEDLSVVRSWDGLPVAAQKFLARISELTGCPIGGFSVGPDREQTIVMDAALREFTLVGQDGY